MSGPKILIYLLRRDLRLADNPIFYELGRLSRLSQRPFTHVLPVYVFPVQQVEVSGFLSSQDASCPYPEARSRVAGFWRCGPHRARFLAETIWDTRSMLERVGSGLEIRIGRLGEVVGRLVEAASAADGSIVAVWMTREQTVEEKMEEREVREVTQANDIQFKLFNDEKYFIDDRDLPFQNPADVPDVFTTYRKKVEPLRDAPRKPLPAPPSLAPFPPRNVLGDQSPPFTIPSSLDELVAALLRPLQKDGGLKAPPEWPQGAQSAHPFHGGETSAHDRVRHLVSSGAMSHYKDTRNGLLGKDFSTKLSAWLALGCLTARQIQAYLIDYEDGKDSLGEGAPGYGKGENKGTAAVRFELLWRDYMRLVSWKFGHRLFRVEGFRQDSSTRWHYPDRDAAVRANVERFLEGRTGIGLIDASQRELYLTGYTSNRARQNVASFLAKHMGVDWRIGCEWYESLLADYDVSSNWGNWQYTAGVGNDPRGEARVFNPVKQAHDYDPQGAYIKTWVSELRALHEPAHIFQAWKVPDHRRAELGLEGLEWVDRPLKRIEYGGRGGQGGRGGRDGRDGRGGRGTSGSRGKGNGSSKGRRGRGNKHETVDRAFQDLHVTD
ncbi:MAG: hypothetical protein M1815_003306 [Lichina confinis]|nr:MAG: hypothetical protein M1815_003306 [Lichina confinis]